MDVLVSLAVRGFWIPAIPAGMTRFSLSWRVWGCNPAPNVYTMLDPSGCINRRKTFRTSNNALPRYEPDFTLLQGFFHIDSFGWCDIAHTFIPFIH